MKKEILSAAEKDERDHYLLLTIAQGWEKLPRVIKTVNSKRRPFYRTQLAAPFSIEERPRSYSDLLAALAGYHQYFYHLTVESAQLSVMVDQDLYLNLLMELGEVIRYPQGDFVPGPAVPFVKVLDSLKETLPHYSRYRPSLPLNHIIVEYARAAYTYIDQLNIKGGSSV